MFRQQNHDKYKKKTRLEYQSKEEWG